MANEKHIFIGIGGSGCQTVSQIKEKVYEKRFAEATAAKTRLQAMNDSYRFLFIDTDQRDIDEANKRNRTSFEQGKVPFISPQTDLINLGRANPHAIYYEAKQNPNTLINKRILEACSPELASKIPDQPLAFGAGAFRMKSRIAFAHALTDFQSKLQSAISSLNDVKTVGGEDCIIYYWVVGSTLGGTGSGIFNDVLYHLNQIHHQVVGNGDPQLVLTMYMPKTYIDSNATEEKYALNAYGVFTELSAFKEMSFNSKQNMVMHRLAFQSDYNLINSSKRYCPFYYLVPIDIQTDKGTSLGTTRTMYRNTAEMLYHLHNGKAGATFRSDIDNYMNDIMERNHKDFLVPMGYVSLQKPNEYFNKYMRSRLKRDVLRSWLLCAEGRDAVVEESSVDGLVANLIYQLNYESSETIAGAIYNSSDFREIRPYIDDGEVVESTNAKGELAPEWAWDCISEILGRCKVTIESKKKSEEIDKVKKVIVDAMWETAEKWIRERGITYAYEAVSAIHSSMAAKLEEVKEVSANADDLQELSDNASKISFSEKFTSGNQKEINEYVGKVKEYIETEIKRLFNGWAYELKKCLCGDEKNDEISKLKKHLARLKEKVAEMNRETVKEYNKLEMAMSDAQMDVTTVYLPQLTTICDGNGWLSNNVFSKLYTTFIAAQQDKEETPERKDLTKLLSEDIYNSMNEQIRERLKNNQYILSYKVEDPKTKKETIREDVRFFCNPELDRSSEKIVEDFLNLTQEVFEKKMRESKDVQEKWDNKKISSFFADLTNDEKDVVRRSLNPALFFSYNNSRIDVIKKEEHIVFVASTEDLAEEMLGYQKGNPKHRFEKADDENTALVLKSKYGLSLEDYRIYDSIKMVYDRATFREKFHFHHDFAQYQNKLTLDNLPDEVLPQHHTFAKILILHAFEDLIKDFFYRDEYFPEDYASSIYLPNEECNEFYLAQPEALSVHPITNQLVLKIKENGRDVFKTIEGVDFAERFAMYSDIYYNYRFAETVESILQIILRQTAKVEGVDKKGEDIIKEHYKEIHTSLLKELSTKKKEARNPSEQRLYNILFSIVRQDFDTVQKFIK